MRKPELPKKNAPRKTWLRFWQELKLWAREQVDKKDKEIARDRRLAKKARKHIERLKRKLEREQINWNGKHPVPYYTKEVRTAQLLGLYVTATKGSPGVHSPTSYHYQSPNYAVDMGHASVQVMINAQNALLNKFGAGHFKELFGPDGWYVKNGVKYSGAFPAHGDHIHFAK